jgi:N-acetyl-gamma-glutamyl-phosphate reductase
MKTCIIGASGYSGRELVGLLLDHPHADLERVTSRSLEGKKVEDCIPKLRGKGCSLSFSNPKIEELCKDENVELFFLALPHGTAAEYAIPLLEAGKKVIDLSADFRLNSSETYEEFYGQAHPAPEWLKKASYGLPELHELSWDHSPLIASPGCYPTSILIPLCILLRENVVKKEGIVANSMSGISGAGRNATEKLLYCERNESAGPYGLPKHRHLSEIEEQLSLLSQGSSEEVVLSFHPHLAPMNRGICTTISALAEGELDRKKVIDCWSRVFGHRPFVNLLPEGEFPDVAHVTGTNRIDLCVEADSRTGRYTLCSAEDNLIKGAGGQAIQSMNICQGYDENAGLI